MNRLLLLLTLACCAALPAAAQWKWRDPSGIVQYSDVPPPPSIADKDILERPVRRAAPAASAPAAAASAASGPAPAAGEPELEARRRAAEQKARQDTAAKAKAEDDRLKAYRAESCERARQQMRTLESGIRISRLNDKGEREVLDDKDRSVEMQRARNIIAADCK